MTYKVVDEHITTALLGSGYAAVHMVLVDDTELGRYWDVQQTGISRYSNREKAQKEAESWAMSEGIRYMK